MTPKVFRSTKFVLAARNLQRSGGRLWVSLFGIAFATFLMCIQGSLLYSFIRAASRVVDSVDADLWIISKGTPTFDYVSSIPERYAELALGVEGVHDAGRGIAGWSPIQRPNGNKTLVMIIGVEKKYQGQLPDVVDMANAVGFADSGLVLDASDASRLGYDKFSSAVQIAGRRGYLLAETSGFASFIGSPLIFTSYVDAHQYLNMDRTQTSFIILHVSSGHDPASVRDVLRSRFRDVDVWTSSELSWRSRQFWLVQTGAGGALTTAAVLGFGIGLVLVAQAIYGITAENIEEFATMKAMGASDRDVHSVVLIQSLLCGIFGGIFGLLAVEPFSVVLRVMVSWMTVPFWMYLVVVGALAFLCILASLIAARPAVRIEPARVFRA